MVTIQLHLPDDLAKKALSITGDIETFIIDILKTRVDEIKQPKSLAEEYYQASIENKMLMKDFVHVDNEGWDDDY